MLLTLQSRRPSADSESSLPCRNEIIRVGVTYPDDSVLAGPLDACARQRSRARQGPALSPRLPSQPGGGLAPGSSIRRLGVPRPEFTDQE